MQVALTTFAFAMRFANVVRRATLPRYQRVRLHATAIELGPYEAVKMIVLYCILAAPIPLHLQHPINGRPVLSTRILTAD